MATVHVHTSGVPPWDFAMLVNAVAGGVLALFIEHVVDFGFTLATRLADGAKMATGNAMSGYHPLDITLFGPIQFITNIGIHADVDIADVPAHHKLEVIARCMRLARPELALPRLLFWFWIASQMLWLHMPIFIMDHKKEEWFEFKFLPLINARDVIAY